MRHFDARWLGVSAVAWGCAAPTVATAPPNERPTPVPVSPALSASIAAPPPVATSAPAPALPAPEPRTLGCGLGEGCALDAEGRAYCWGGWDIAPAPGKYRGAYVTGAPKAATLAVGVVHACVLSVEGEVWCWGGGAMGELGDGFAISNDGSGRIAHAARRAARVTLPTKVTELAAGVTNTCAILADQTVACWGDHVHGVLGDAKAPSSTPRVIPGVTGAVELAVGEDQACARRADGEVWCWGEMVTSRKAVPPTRLEGLCARQITVGTAEGYAIACDGSLRGWGLQSGASREDSFAVATVKGAPADLVEVRAAYAHACTRNKTGDVWCWGHNASGQLGTPQVSDGIVVEGADAPQRATAARMKARHLCTGGMNMLNTGGYKVAARYVEAGATCIASETGEIECWGEPARTPKPMRVTAPKPR